MSTAPTVPPAHDTAQPLADIGYQCVGRRWSAARRAELLADRRPLPPVPVGHEYATNRWTWARDVKAHIREIGGRADRVDGLITVTEMLASGWHPVTVVSSPGHDRIADRLDCSDRTVTRLMRVMEQRGYILCTGPGRTVTPEGISKNLRAEYALLRPKAAETFAQNGSERRCGSSAWDMRACPGRKGERHAAAAALIARIQRFAISRLDGSLWESISAAAVASVCRPFFVAGWSPADILHAIDYRPDEGRWSFDQGPRSVIGWLRARLSWWLTSSGAPRASRAQRQRAEHDAGRRRAAERAAEAAELRAVLVPAGRRSAAQQEALAAAKAAARSAARRPSDGGSDGRRDGLSTGLNVGPSRSPRGSSKKPLHAGAGRCDQRPASAGREAVQEMVERLRSGRRVDGGAGASSGGRPLRRPTRAAAAVRRLRRREASPTETTRVE